MSLTTMFCLTRSWGQVDEEMLVRDIQAEATKVSFRLSVNPHDPDGLSFRKGYLFISNTFGLASYEVCAFRADFHGLEDLTEGHGEN